MQFQYSNQILDRNMKQSLLVVSLTTINEDLK